MSLVYDNSQVQAHSFNDPVTMSYSCGATAKLLVVLLSGANRVQRLGGGVTYNSIPMTQAGSTYLGSGECNTELWYLISPPTGSSYTISVPNTDTLSTRFVAISFYSNAGIPVTISLNQTTGSDTSTDLPSLTLNNVPDGSAVVNVLAHGAKDVCTANSHTLIGTLYDAGNWNNGNQYHIMTSADNITMTFTATGSDDVANIIASFEEIIDSTSSLSSESVSSESSISSLSSEFSNSSLSSYSSLSSNLSSLSLSSLSESSLSSESSSSSDSSFSISISSESSLSSLSSLSSDSSLSSESSLSSLSSDSSSSISLSSDSSLSSLSSESSESSLLSESSLSSISSVFFESSESSCSLEFLNSGQILTSKVESNNESTDSTTIGNITHVSTCIKLTGTSHIMAWLSLSASVDTANKKGYFAISINGVDSRVIGYHFTDADYQDSIGVVYRTAAPLLPGTYSVKAKWYTQNGIILSGENISLTVMVYETLTQ